VVRRCDHLVAEVFDLFDDVLLLAEGHIVYHGPKDEVNLCFCLRNLT
jgi:ABC-type multidrug transport system ATPase subunit